MTALDLAYEYSVVKFKGYAVNQSMYSNTCEYFLALELGLCNVRQLFELFNRRVPSCTGGKRGIYQLKVDIVQEICRAVESLHRNKCDNFAHGDLHESNILVMPDGRVKLTDVGFSVVRSEAKNASVFTQCRRPENGSCLPGQRYQPPEIMRRDQKNSSRSADIFQLGWMILSIFMANSWQHTNEDPKMYPYEQSPHFGPGMLKESVYSPLPKFPPEPSFPNEIKANFHLKHLLKCMLAYDDIERPTISHVLTHPFFLSLADKEIRLREFASDFMAPPLINGTDQYFREEIYRMRTTVPFIEAEYLQVDSHLEGHNTIDDATMRTTMKWRNDLSVDFPSIFMKTSKNKQKSTEYFPVGTEGGLSLYDYEEHWSLVSHAICTDAAFYKRFHGVVRFSRNMLEHLKEKDDQIKEKFKEKMKNQAGWKNDDKLRDFVFLHPGLNWILPAMWEMKYKTMQNMTIEAEQLKDFYYGSEHYTVTKKN